MKEINLEKFKLLLRFLKGDRRIRHSFDWSMSIGSKVEAIKILYNEVLEQIPRCLEEFKEVERVGYSNGIEALKLAIKFEVYLNSIYALCENLSRVVFYLYPARALPQSFREQKKRFLKNTSLDLVYSEILKGTDWYDEVNSMRSESIHFLSGFIIVNSPTELGYFNDPKSKRIGALKKIQINDIKKHIKEIHGKVFSFLSSFGDYFITYIDKDTRVVLICLRTNEGLIGTRMKSLKEFLDGEPGVCNVPLFDCPEKEKCEARKHI